MVRSLLVAVARPTLAALAVAGLPVAVSAADAAAIPTGPIVVQAAPPGTRTISLTASARVTYEPDLAELAFGVRSTGATAAEAANSTNAIGAKLIAALEALGIAKHDVQTSQYEVSFQEATPPTYAQKPDGERVVVQPARPALYTVTTALNLKAPIAKAGDAIDAALRSGANADFQLSFASSRIDDYYAQALTQAMQVARARATSLAAAAGVSLEALQSVTTSGNAPSGEAEPGLAGARMYARAAAPIAGGSQSVDASVDVVYAIK